MVMKISCFRDSYRMFRQKRDPPDAWP